MEAEVVHKRAGDSKDGNLKGRHSSLTNSSYNDDHCYLLGAHYSLQHP